GAVPPLTPLTPLAMFNGQIITALGRLWRGEPPGEPCARLLTPDQTREALRRERARCDRGGRLSVVGFTARGKGPARDALGRLARLLQGQLRATDVLGWLGDERLCVVLPATPPEGAQAVAERGRQLLPAGGAAPAYTVLTYPRPGVNGAGSPRPEAP